VTREKTIFIFLYGNQDRQELDYIVLDQSLSDDEARPYMIAQAMTKEGISADDWRDHEFSIIEIMKIARWKLREAVGTQTAASEGENSPGSSNSLTRLGSEFHPLGERGKSLEANCSAYLQ
jgi:hypothetical protein